MKLLREQLDIEISLLKHKANKHSTRKTIGCFAEPFATYFGESHLAKRAIVHLLS